VDVITLTLNMAVTVEIAVLAGFHVEDQTPSMELGTLHSAPLKMNTND